MTCDGALKATLDCSPVLALEHNITAAFESFHGNVADLVAGGLLDAEVLLEVDAAPPRTPNVSRTTPAQMRVHVAMLELLWAFIYSWMVIYEETVQKAQLRGDEVGSTNESNELLVSRAEKLWVWARELRNGYSPWPSDLPSPRAELNEQERWYAEKANYVFERATSFQLTHELAHVTQGHLAISRDEAAQDALSAQLENEADLRAFEALVEQGFGDEEKLAQAWAVFSVMLASLFTCSDLRSALKTRRHPPLHHRLAHLANALDFQVERYRYYYPLLCRVVLQDAFPELARPGQHYEDADDSFQAALDALDRIAASSLP